MLKHSVFWECFLCGEGTIEGVNWSMMLLRTSCAWKESARRGGKNDGIPDNVAEKCFILVMYSILAAGVLGVVIIFYK